MKYKNIEESKRSILSNARFSYHYLIQYEGRKCLVLVPLFLLFSVASPFLGMAFPSIAVSQMLSPKAPEQILLAVLLAAALLQVVQIAQIYTSDRVHQFMFLFRIRFAYVMHEHSMSMSYSCLESVKGQKMLEQGNKAIWYGNDTGIEAFLNQIQEFLIQVIGLVLYSILVGRKNLWMLAILLVTTGIVSVMNYQAEKYERNHKEEERKESMRYGYLCEQSIHTKNAKDVRLYPMKNWLMHAMDEAIDKLLMFYKKELARYNRANTVEKLLALLRDCLIYGYFIQQMIHGKLKVDEFILLVGVTAGFSNWMEGIFHAFAEIIRNNIIMDECRNYLEYGIVKNKSVPQEWSRHKGKTHEISMEHVSFRYPDAKEDTIHDLSLILKRGEKLALVGMNGAGKTTLVKLICGLYHPTEGRILIDGMDMASLPEEDYFQEFSAAFQDVFAFSFSLADNITCQDGDSQDRAKLDHCLEQADLAERVQRLPKQEKTMMNQDIDPEGVRLSGGEMQKMMLARALYKDAPVILLDEPTAALDPIAESELYEKYDSLIEGKSSVFISHRLSSTKFCDRIVFLEYGQIVEEGSHDELMQRDGKYAHMFWVQAHYYQKNGMEEECHA